MQASVSVAEFDALYAAMPEEFTAELVGGRILVSTALDGDHSESVRCVADQVHARLPDIWLYQGCSLTVGAHRDVRARADGVVAARGYLRGQPSWADPAGALLALEVTSGTEAEAEVDRVEKRDAYAASGIPIYLLVDRRRGEAVVFWVPAGGRYTHHSSAVFGEKLLLPEPFGFELDTAEFS